VLDVVERYPDRFRVTAISSRANATLLKEQAEKFRPEKVVMGSDEGLTSLKDSLAGTSEVISGSGALEEIAAGAADIVFFAISGTAALKPLIAALKAGKTVALASKEPVVSAGMLIKEIAGESGARIIPVDSEHSAVMQCLAGRSSDEVKTLYLTGSGGPLKDRAADEFGSVTMEEVLAHPKWDMGRKITVDSATLMNKGLEVIEARWLFDVPEDRIKVVIHPEAIIHSMVEFVDGTVSACLFQPDMRFPILKALSYPDVVENDFPRLDFSEIKDLSFGSPDRKTFPALDLAFEALGKGGTYPAVLNGANEAAVSAFLDGKIAFTDIIKKVKEAITSHKAKKDPTLEDIIDSEKWAYEEVMRSC